MIKQLLCKVKGHKLVLTHQDNLHIKEFTCRCCYKEFTEDGYGKIVGLNKYWRENHSKFKEYLQEQYS
ncbi:MAG: hypothetical protein ABJM06_12060 [Gilvibacter sp.]